MFIAISIRVCCASIVAAKMPSFLSALCLLVCLGRCWVQGVDTTLTRGEIGKDVVDAVVAKIEASDIFPTDNRLLHRIAYVESKYGMETLSPTSCRNDYKGGIWQVDEAAFMRSKDPTLLEFHDSIEDNFDDVVGNAIEWIDVTWCDLRMPFYSGLAARLLLHLSSIEEAFPAAGNIAGQAAYWKEHYNGDDSVTVEKFEEDVTALGDLEEESMSLTLLYKLQPFYALLVAMHNIIPTYYFARNNGTVTSN